MPLYHALGEFPKKRHSVFRQGGGALHHEELIGNKGFTGPSSLLYHLHPPTVVRHAALLGPVHCHAETEYIFRHRHFRTTDLTPGPSPTLDRIPLLFNQDVNLAVAAPRRDDDFFFRNAEGDEIIFVSEGGGVLESVFGELDLRKGDYVVIPRGILHRYRLGQGPHRFLVIESDGYVRAPRRYRNDHGQLNEQAPYSERDIRRPRFVAPRDEKGDFRVLIRKENALAELEVSWHPFDVAGWDGYYYPWALNIEDFEPRVGRFHLPPPVHQTFEGDGFVVCSFCPRPFDFDPQAVPAPYNHSNVMSDEVLFYANSEFMSRKGIQYGSLTLHPDGIPHGPHPGRYEGSIGQKETNELAVMVDTFRPLKVSAEASAIEDPHYWRSWLEES